MNEQTGVENTAQTNNTQAATPAPAKPTPAPAVVELVDGGKGDGVKFKKETFQDGDFKGFSFMTPVFGTLEAAAAHYGSSNVLALVNTQVSARLRSMTKNKLPKNLKGAELEKYKSDKMISAPDGCLLSIDNAFAWKPDAREESTNSIFKDIKAALKEGNVQKVFSELLPKLATAIAAEGGGTIDPAQALAQAMAQQS